QGAGFPVTLTPKAVPVRHQTLYSEARQLLKPVQDLKIGRESLVLAIVQKASQAQFNPSAVTKCLMTHTPFAEFFRDVVALLILLAEPGNFLVADPIYVLDQVTDTITVHRKTKPCFG